MKHDFVFFVMIPLTDKEVDRVSKGGRITFRKIDPESGHVRHAHVACFRCELSLERAIHVPCLGEPDGHDEDGLPFWNRPAGE